MDQKRNVLLHDSHVSTTSDGCSRTVIIPEDYSSQVIVDTAEGVVANSDEDSLDIMNSDGRTFVVFDDDGNAAAVQIDGLLLENGSTSVKKLLSGETGHTLVVKVNKDGEFELDPLIQAIKAEVKADDSTEEVPGTVNQNWFTRREDKSSFQNMGHSWKQGMWSTDEIEMLQNNIATYCEEHGFMDPNEIIFDMSKDQRKDFYRVVANGINRPLFSVYRRVIRMYDNKNHVGKYNSAELQRLRELRQKHGNDWQKIGTALGRSASSIRDRCRLMKDNCNTGKWSSEEEDRLARAVYDLTNAIPGEQVTSGISWSQVAEIVATRSEKQCRTKWLNYLNWKNSGGCEWTRDDDVKLVARLMCVNVSEENEIDWSDLAKGWLAVRSPQWLRGKWWNLKRHLRGHQNLPFRVSTNANSMSANAMEKEDDLSTATVPTPLTLGVMPSSIVIGCPVSGQTDSGGTTQEVFIHTLPVEALASNENVTVQVNPSAQLIISSAEATSLLQQNTVDETEDHPLENSASDSRVLEAKERRG
ncbi:cyclin-D-binding Myb-like transcription factor 1 [Ischnura elegans]|uniref:cyclin-D-binding Myb-like transcription factor 1 n=1 Tax=Ischnura elegans TaxID=197161 RepID=UPI001ED88387|nr:cyclin-D-binding Myb-like transcription factor 1 [Ischnura elegans]